jgi:hypothetical protein
VAPNGNGEHGGDRGPVPGRDLPEVVRPADSAARDQLNGDEVALDLVGALADDHERGVGEEPLDVELGRVSVAPVDPHRVQRDLHGRLGREQLRHPGLHVATLA